MIKIAIADDQTLLRQMLSIILSQNDAFSVVGEAEDGHKILSVCRATKPDVVLMDMRMPIADGVFALEAIKSEFPEIKVIMLTTFEDEKNVLRAYSGGADGYILKDVEPQMLMLSIKCVYDGMFVVYEGINSILRRYVKAALTGRPQLLDTADALYDEFGLDVTDRKILKMVTDGKSNREIAAELSFTEGTIKNKISRILNITGLKDRTQVAVFALKNDLI